MKRTIIQLFAILVLSVMITSCEESEPLFKEAKKIELHKKSAEIIEADKAFSFELFQQVCLESEGENLMISPLSVSYALGMTYNGAAGTTLEAFNDVLHFGDLTKTEVNESYKDLMEQMLDLDQKVEFSIANSIWYRLGFQVLDAFINTNKTYFDAEVSEVDFGDPATLDAINNWIEDKTNDKIKDMLDFIPAEAVMYLINAIYFNAPWKYEFDKAETYQGDFNLADGTRNLVDYMRVSGDFQYTSNEDFTAVELPYGDSAFSMVVMLPTPRNGVDLPSPGNELSDLVAKLDGAHWDSWFENSWFTAVQLDMPKFKYGWKDLLNDPLINLGLGVAFSDGADFTRITPSGDIYISRVIHQTFIDVQEEGTEAAAATIVEMSWTSAGGGSPIQFKADRPFLYVIKENSTGAILFIGKVGKPEHP
ncbi:MAG: serpin family protein [Bacteroidota bacterium]